MNIPRKRSGSGSSKKTKEKYEILFKNEENEENLSENVFNEIINSAHSIALEAFDLEISKVNFEQAAVVRKNFNQLLNLCIKNCIDEDGELLIILSLAPISKIIIIPHLFQFKSQRNS
jgi:hypothetical protein